MLSYQTFLLRLGELRLVVETTRPLLPVKKNPVNARTAYAVPQTWPFPQIPALVTQKLKKPKRKSRFSSKANISSADLRCILRIP